MEGENGELEVKDERTLAEKLKAALEAAEKVVAARIAAVERQKNGASNQELNQSASPSEDKSQ